MMARDTKGCLDEKIKTAIGCMLMKSIKPEINGSLLFMATSAKPKKTWQRSQTILRNRGYRVLVPDLRSHGQSEGDSIGMGAMDSGDIVEWSKYILKQDSSASIALYGVSMGASTVMMASGNEQPGCCKSRSGRLRLYKCLG